ncbi:MAG TPA: hypothetical protein PK205_07010 [Promineifilum sp.]|nr:hypothetical protein [Promineifilum sp.]
MGELRTGVGRIVWGHPCKAQTKKDQRTNQPVLKDGQPIQQWVFGVAFPKAEFQATIWPAMAAEAATGYPQGVPQGFSWKYKDGDGVDKQGKPYNTREGYAGCYVLTISTEAFAPPVFRFANGGYVQMQANELKTGDYVALALNVKVNVPKNASHTPGLYINPVAVEFVGFGQEIVATADPMALFGGRQHQLPPGASMTPLAPATGVGMPGTAGPLPGAPGAMAPIQPAMSPPPGAPTAYPSNVGVPGYAAPTTAPGYPPPGAGQIAPPVAPMAPAAPGYPPAHDFVHAAPGMPSAPVGPGGMPPMPGMMPPR